MYVLLRNLKGLKARQARVSPKQPCTTFSRSRAEQLPVIATWWSRNTAILRSSRIYVVTSCMPPSERNRNGPSKPLGQGSQHTLIRERSHVGASKLPPKTLQFSKRTNRIIFHLFALIILIIISIIFFILRIPSFTSHPTTLKKTSLNCDLTHTQTGHFETIFAINLRGGTHLSFTQAKAIDIVWQLFIGAGGRFVLAGISYRAFMDGIVRLIEQDPVSYDFYTSVTFSTTSLMAIFHAMEGFFITDGFRGKLFCLWFTFSTTYILGFPTLMSATAGYISPQIAGYNMSDDVFLTTESPKLTNCFTIENGDQNGTIAIGPPVSEFDFASFKSIPSNFSRAVAAVPDIVNKYPLYAWLLNCKSLFLVSFAELTRGNLGTIAIAELDKFIDNPSDRIEGCNNSTSSYPLLISGDYCYLNHSIPDLGKLAQCLPTNYFEWGFSSLMIYINLILFIIWMIGMCFVWVEANLHSDLCRSGRKVRGPYRAAVDLAEAMSEVLGHETCAYSDKELSKALSQERGVRYYTSRTSEGDVSHIGISSRKLGQRVKCDSTKFYGKSGDEL